MKYLIRHIASVIILCTAYTLSQAQSLQEHYKATHISTKGCKTYDGLLDEIFELEMLICGDKGIYKMKSSADIYQLTIDNIDGTLEILEEDIHGRNSGFISLTKSTNGFSGEWSQIESAAKYSFSIYEDESVKEMSEHYISKLSGDMRSRLVNIYIDHVNGTAEIQEKYGLQGRHKSEYICKDEKCNTLILNPKGIIGVSSIEIDEDKKGAFKMIVLTADQHREVNDLQIQNQALKKTKAYSDYRSMLLAEYAVFGDNDLDEYLDQIQANWLRETSIKLREIHKSDPIEIVSDRLKNQASSWLDIEVWTEDFISGVQYNQYNWESEVEAIGFAYHIDKSKDVSLADVWDNEWNLNNLESKINKKNSTWVVGYEGLYKIYFDRIKGVQRESFPYTQLAEHIDGGSWLDRLLDQNKIKD